MFNYSIFSYSNSAWLLPQLSQLGADALKVDWRVNLRSVSEAGAKVVQGNLDPTLLFADTPRLTREAQRILEEGIALKGPHIQSWARNLA